MMIMIVLLKKCYKMILSISILPGATFVKNYSNFFCTKIAYRKNTILYFSIVFSIYILFNFTIFAALVPSRIKNNSTILHHFLRRISSIVIFSSVEGKFSSSLGWTGELRHQVYILKTYKIIWTWKKFVNIFTNFLFVHEFLHAHMQAIAGYDLAPFTENCLRKQLLRKKYPSLPQARIEITLVNPEECFDHTAIATGDFSQKF